MMNAMGIVAVAALAARGSASPGVTITATRRTTRLLASSDSHDHPAVGVARE
jgi:hypothetical protein